MPGVPRALRRDPEPLPPRQRALPPQRRPARRGRDLQPAARRDRGRPAGRGADRRAGRPDARRTARGQRLRPHPPRPRARRSSDALAQAPPRAPAQADPKQPWRRITLTDDTVRRPPGLRFDTGGTGKGLAADLLASRLDGRFAIDCGGDIRVGGAFDDRGPPPAHRTRASTRCTSRTPRSPPRASTPASGNTTDARAITCSIRPPGDPAWTGLISVTALAPTALEAEALAKAALLSGPRQARKWLKHHGGLLITDDGDVHVV